MISRTALRLTLRLSVVALLLATASCSKKPTDPPLRDDFPNEPGGNPLVPRWGLLPFPSDFYLEDDPTTPTGRRVVIPSAVLHRLIPTSIFDQDGFSMAPALLAWLEGGVALSSLPDPLDPGATLEDTSPVYLIKAGTWERIPALAELDQNTTDLDQQSLIIRAHHKLDPNTGYVVILRDLLRRADNGERHTPTDAFVALRDGIPTAFPDIEKQRASFELVNDAIAQEGLDPQTVVLAWAFHTRSESGVVDHFLNIQQQTWAAPVGTWATVDDFVDSRQNRVIEATFQAPNFRNADELVEFDATGLPILQGYHDVPFRITIADSVDEPRPVIVYGHGFLGHYDQASRGAVNQLSRAHRYSTVATDLGFNEIDAGGIIGVLTGNLDNFHWLVSLNWQKMANFTALAKLTRDRLSQEVTHDIGGGSFLPLDGSRMYYSGISNGGTFGYLIASTSPAFERACLIVGGGGLTHFLQRAVNWRDFQPGFALLYPFPMDVQLLLALLQGPIDPVDPINYVHRLTNDRFPNLPPMQAAVHMAVNDSQVRNILTEWVARTADVPLITPSAKDIWGLRTVTAASPLGNTTIDSGLFVYDEHVEQSPITNVPPLQDNDTHGTATRLPVFQEHWYQFLEFGRFVQVCDGPCDPL